MEEICKIIFSKEEQYYMRERVRVWEGERVCVYVYEIERK
jgi:hypothetical protein